jgi:hypothetical protein
LKVAAPVFDTLDQNPNVLGTRREENQSNCKIQVSQIVHNRLPTAQQMGDMISRDGAGADQMHRQELVALVSDTFNQNPHGSGTRRDGRQSNCKVRVPQIVHNRLPTAQQMGEMKSHDGAGAV